MPATSSPGVRSEVPQAIVWDLGEPTSCCVILVRLGRAENAVQIGALVPYRKVHEIAAVGGEDTLHVAHERIEPGRRGIVVVVDAAEP